MSWNNFISKIKPDGKAFRNISFTKHFYDTMAYGLNLIKEYAVYTLSDQVWYVNSNFNPEPWEERYLIEVPSSATLQERREVVKAYMLYPQSLNRLSKDFIKNTLIEAGFTDIDIEYNPTGLTTGYLRANDFGDEKLTFSLGSLTYNSFIISGEITATYYANAIAQTLALKPLQVALYDQLDVLSAIALDDSTAIALDDSTAIAINVL